MLSDECHETEPSEEKSTLIQVMAWCRQAASHYLNQCWLSSMSPYIFTRVQWVNTLRPRKNGRHFTDDIFNCIFLNENVWISIEISLKSVPKGPIDNMPALVQRMAWLRRGNKPLSEQMMVRSLTHICVTQPQWVNMLWSHNDSYVIDRSHVTTAIWWPLGVAVVSVTCMRVRWVSHTWKYTQWNIFMFQSSDKSPYWTNPYHIGFI